MENKLKEAIDQAVANLQVDNLNVTKQQKEEIKSKIETIYLNKTEEQIESVKKTK